jgi:hypothetical protein
LSVGKSSFESDSNCHDVKKPARPTSYNKRRRRRRFVPIRRTVRRTHRRPVLTISQLTSLTTIFVSLLLLSHSLPPFLLSLHDTLAPHDRHTFTGQLLEPACFLDLGLTD